MLRIILSSREMIELLAKLIDLLLKGAEQRKSLIESKRRRQLLLDLLTTYFVLRNVSSTGERLIAHAGDDPITRVTTMPVDAAKKWMVECKYLMLAQRANLHRLSNLLGYEGLPALDILDASLRADLRKVIGSKGSGLYSLGAGLEMYLLFGGLPTKEDVARFGDVIARLRSGATMLQLLLAGESTQPSIAQMKADLQHLQSASERLRETIGELCEHKEMLDLSAEAERRADDKNGIELDSAAGEMIYDMETCPFQSVEELPPR